MKKRRIISLFVAHFSLMFLASCIIRNEPVQQAGAVTTYADESRIYNVKCVIREKGFSTNNSSHDGCYFLIQRVDYPFTYTELNDSNWRGFQETRKYSSGYSTGSALYWSKEVGDTLFFEYIEKDRFWKKIE
jgi:hypothetical protein